MWSVTLIFSQNNITINALIKQSIDSKEYLIFSNIYKLAPGVLEQITKNILTQT